MDSWPSGDVRDYLQSTRDYCIFIGIEPYQRFRIGHHSSHASRSFYSSKYQASLKSNSRVFSLTLTGNCQLIFEISPIYNLFSFFIRSCISLTKLTVVGTLSQQGWQRKLLKCHMLPCEGEAFAASSKTGQILVLEGKKKKEWDISINLQDSGICRATFSAAYFQKLPSLLSGSKVFRSSLGEQSNVS